MILQEVLNEINPQFLEQHLLQKHLKILLAFLKGSFKLNLKITMQMNRERFMKECIGRMAPVSGSQRGKFSM